MKVCLYGAGAVGGFLGAQLGRTGCELSVVEVGPTLQAQQKHGLRVQMKDELLQQPVTATDNPATLGAQDLIVQKGITNCVHVGAVHRGHGVCERGAPTVRIAPAGLRLLQGLAEAGFVPGVFLYLISAHVSRAS